MISGMSIIIFNCNCAKAYAKEFKFTRENIDKYTINFIMKARLTYTN
jgi:hypothetical protein